MPCAYHADDGWVCPEPSLAGKTECSFHDSDWQNKPQRAMQVRLQQMVAQAAAGSVIRCDGWVFPHLDVRGLKFGGSVNFSFAQFHGHMTSFQDAEFHGDETSFEGATFHSKMVWFNEAKFHGQQVRFVGTRFESGQVWFDRTEFRSHETWFDGVVFNGEAWFTSAEFHGVKTSFFLARFQGEQTSFLSAKFHSDEVTFKKARFSGRTTRFDQTEFRGRCTSLRLAGLKGALFTGTTFATPPVMTGTDLEGADLRESRGIILDSTFIRGTRFDERASDPWSVLRRNYTGTMFTFHLLLLLVFLAPYVARTGMLLGLNRGQEVAQDVSRRAADEIVAVAQARNVSPVILEGARIAADRIRQLRPCLADNCREFRVAQVLLGWDRSAWWSVLVSVLLIYNMLRGVLTYHVSLMRDAEERSGFSPRWSRGKPAAGEGFMARLSATHWSYGWLYAAHGFMRVFIFVAIASAAVHLYDWLSRTVWLPAL